MVVVVVVVDSVVIEDIDAKCLQSLGIFSLYCLFFLPSFVLFWERRRCGVMCVPPLMLLLFSSCVFNPLLLFAFVESNEKNQRFFPFNVTFVIIHSEPKDSSMRRNC